MMTVNSTCRICKGTNLTKVIDLGQQPLANAFLRQEDLARQEEKFPLEVHFCQNCNLAQLVHVVDKEKLFRDYIYFSSGMPRLSDHFKMYAEDIIGRFLKPQDLVVEIGSNDGILLAHFSAKGFRVLGVDPAVNIAPVAEKSGVRTITDFWSEAVAKNIAKEEGGAKAIVGNNVVAHINDYDELCRGVKSLLHKDGVFIFEAPYLVDMFLNLTFDTIYHEHLSFLAVRPLQKLFARFGLEIFEVKVVSAQGQSIRVFVGHKGARAIHESVQACVRQELELGLDKTESYLVLAKKIEESKEKVRKIVYDLKSQGKKIAAYGAPAKGNTLLNYFNVGADVLEFAMDELPSKQGLYTPGKHVLAVDKAYANSHIPDYYLLLAWNYLKVILEKENEYIENGGAFILPTGKIVDKKDASAAQDLI